MSPSSQDTADSTTPIALAVLGHDVVVRVPSDAADEIRQQWVRCVSDAAPEDLPDAPVVTGTPDHDGDTGWQYGLTTEVTFAALKDAGNRLNLHAAGLADSSGGVLALIGPSGRGKTTAAAHLGTTMGYVTDECVSVDWEDLSVQPYPKPLSVVTDPAKATVKKQHSPDAMELLPAEGPLHLRGLVILDRDPEASEAELERLDPIEGLLEVIPQTSRLMSMERPLASLTALIERLGGVHRLRYSEIAQVDEPVKQLLAQEPATDSEELGFDLLDQIPLGPATDPLTDTDQAPPVSPDELAAEAEKVDADTMVVQVEPRDVVAHGAEFVVLYGTVPHHLGVLPALVWEYATTPIKINDLHQIAETELGENPESRDLVVQSAQSLVAHGCMRRVLSD